MLSNKVITRNCLTRACVAVAIGGSSLLMGCTRTVVVHDHDAPPVVRTRETVVIEAPPPPRVERAPAPRSGYVWVEGHYRHDGRRYEWVPGRWERVPRVDARYVPGRWNRNDRGYIWIEGRWD